MALLYTPYHLSREHLGTALQLGTAGTSRMLSQADRNYSTRSQSSQANCDSGNTAERLICFGLGLRRRHVEICVPLELSEDGGPIQLVQLGRLQAGFLLLGESVGTRVT